MFSLNLLCQSRARIKNTIQLVAKKMYSNENQRLQHSKSTETYLKTAEKHSTINSTAASILIVHTEKHRLHNPKMYFALGRMDPYPEQPSRVESILKALEARKTVLRHSLVGPKDFGLQPIVAVHSEKYLNYLKTAYDRWILKGGDSNGVIPDTYGVHLKSIYRDITLKTRSDNVFAEMGLYTFDSATVIVKDTYIAAYEAAQVALTAAESMINNNLNSAYALCRPPGHHSSDELLGGFCFMNNAAIATRYLIEKHNLKVCILDIGIIGFHISSLIYRLSSWKWHSMYLLRRRKSNVYIYSRPRS